MSFTFMCWLRINQYVCLLRYPNVLKGIFIFVCYYFQQTCFTLLTQRKQQLNKLPRSIQNKSCRIKKKENSKKKKNPKNSKKIHKNSQKKKKTQRVGCKKRNTSNVFLKTGYSSRVCEWRYSRHINPIN